MSILRSLRKPLIKEIQMMKRSTVQGHILNTVLKEKTKKNLTDTQISMIGVKIKRVILIKTMITKEKAMTELMMVLEHQGRVKVMNILKIMQ
jgi:hypothetical protein